MNREPRERRERERERGARPREAITRASERESERESTEKLFDERGQRAGRWKPRPACSSHHHSLARARSSPLRLLRCTALSPGMPLGHPPSRSTRMRKRDRASCCANCWSNGERASFLLFHFLVPPLPTSSCSSSFSSYRRWASSIWKDNWKDECDQVDAKRPKTWEEILGELDAQNPGCRLNGANLRVSKLDHVPQTIDCIY